MRPLSDPEIEQLIRRWFAEAARKLPDAEHHSWQQRDRLLAALATPAYSTQAWKVLTGNPLLLTLLCLLTYRGHRMPDSRGEFYSRALEVLLARHGEGGDERPLGDAQTLASLRRLAFAMHRQRTADVSRVRLVRLFSEPLRKAGDPCKPLDLLDRLHRHAGVLESFGSNRFGFLHLGLQEYLAAAYLRDDSTDELPQICAELTGPEDRWWHEPLLLLAGLAGRQVASALLAALCQGPPLEVLPALVGDCLAAMSEVDLTPLQVIAGDDGAGEGRRQQARRLLAVHAPPPAAARAEDRLLLCHHPEHAGPARDLAAGLRRQGLAPWLAAEQVPPGGDWQDHLEQILEVSSVVVLVGPEAPPPWHDDDTADCLRTLVDRGRTLLCVSLPGLDLRPELPGHLQGRWVGPEAALIAARLAEPARPEPGRALVDQVTGVRLLLIPAGTFRMGADDLGPEARPVHQVSLSPFWLAETPLTNAQYARFLAATGHREPELWRDARFSDPQQPVVSVGWYDAVAYCRWAAEASGRPYVLPSEAQWEYAARGEGSRRYPWGDEEPTPELACYGLDSAKDRPAEVGSCPRGAGPFGTLDQAGLAWEWCRDVWDSRAYGQEDRGTGDPLVEQGDTRVRVVRGGCWFSPALYLRAAFRSRDPAGFRSGGVGFRVAVARASTVTAGSRGGAPGRDI